ncbi:MAG TPA: response regulator [Terriglobales bacterium]|nr:response regulator [Terriglobales bacterium]
MAKIMIVDDSVISRKKLRMILEAAGHEVVGEISDGTEAVQKYQELSPELVTMDVTMPKIDGITAVKELMKHDPSVRVVMVTALGKGETILEALGAGAKNYITKPYEDAQVDSAIREALQSA